MSKILQKIPIAQEGYTYIFSLLLLAVIFYFSGITWLFTLFTILFLFTAYFFRDPGRVVSEHESNILSPADGKIVQITPTTINKQKFNKISIFLSIFNVHINRIPMTGSITEVKYNPGAFLPAFNDKASEKNEQTALTIKNKDMTVIVKQIAGLIARRIVCYPKINDKVIAGKRFGLIKFGSRVDIFLPDSIKIHVKKGEKVKAGISVIGVIQ